MSGFRVHTVINDSVIASDGYKIYKSNDYGENWFFCGKLPMNPLKKFLSNSNLISRLTRMGISQIKRIHNDNMIVCCDGLFFLSDLELCEFTKIDIPSSFFQLLDNSICVTSDYVYYGEYFPNVKRKKVKIFRIREGVEWKEIYVFPEKRIKHIHVLQHDPFTQRIWFSTGDADEECMVGHADVDFSNVEIIGENSQKWRTLEFLFTKDKVFWGMDTPERRSCLVEYDRDSRETKLLGRFDGPVYNLKEYKNWFLVGTANEGGKGEIDNCAHLWVSKNLEDWEDLVYYEKDVYPYLAGFGRILFPDKLEEKIVFSGLGLKEIDNKTIVGEI
ncbi:MAG: hypothetical protein ACOC80_03725 [Petrotogales bacterium]